MLPEQDDLWFFPYRTPYPAYVPILPTWEQKLELTDMFTADFEYSRYTLVGMRKRHLLPRRGGVYIVSHEGVVLYVGMARKDIRQRWANHHQSKNICAHIWASHPEVVANYPPPDVFKYDSFEVDCIPTKCCKYGISITERILARVLKPLFNDRLINAV